MPPRTTAPGSPITVCAWSRTSGPWCTPAASRTVGGSTAQAVPTTASSTSGERGGEDAAGRGQLAAVLGPAEPQQRQARVRKHLEHEPREGEERNGRPERRVELEQPRGAHRQPQLEEAERDGEPARLVGKEPVVEQDVEREPDCEHHPHQLERPPDVQEGESTAATANGSSEAASRVSIRPLSV